jgi:ATP-dependent RNA helicase DeaD
LFKERILKTLAEDGAVDGYLSLVEELAEESGRDMAEIAAAAARLAQGDKPIDVEVEPEPELSPQPGDGMVRLFIDVGRHSKVSPADIVGAIANEAGVPGRAIGAIDVHDRFTLVDVPSEYVEQVLQRMSGSRIRGHNANVRTFAPPEGSRNDARAKTTPRRQTDKGKKGAPKKGGKISKR